MAWTKIPPENHPRFRAALPADPRIETLQMFGGVAAKVNGHLFGGTFARSVMLLLSEADRTEALALDGAAPFDPMGNGAMRSDKVQMPEALMDDPAELRSWVRRSFDYAATLARKSKPGKATQAKPKAKAKPAKAVKSTKAVKAVKAAKPARKPAARKRPART
jgi:TfoX/Sxy family transcriptional regulator of competence genes